MKKILIVIYALLLFSLVACGEFSTRIDPKRIDGRELLLELVEKFGKADYEDLEWVESKQECLCEPYTAVMYEEDSTIGIVIFGGQYSRALIEIGLTEESNSLETYIYEISFTYTDDESEIYVELKYELLDLFDPDSKVFAKPQRLIARELSYLTVEDIEWVLVELGYNVIE